MFDFSGDLGGPAWSSLLSKFFSVDMIRREVIVQTVEE